MRLIARARWLASYLLTYSSKQERPKAGSNEALCIRQHGRQLAVFGNLSLGLGTDKCCRLLRRQGLHIGHIYASTQWIGDESNR